MLEHAAGEEPQRAADNNTTVRRMKKDQKSQAGIRQALFAQRQTAFAVRTLIATVGVVGAAMNPALAQSEAPTPTATLPTITVTDESNKGYVAPRSTTATKTDTLLRDTPQSVSVVTQDQIRDQSSQGLAEALRYMPGVGFAQGEGNRETPIFRGISTTGDFFADGIRDDVQYYRDLYNIESVEVFRGPNAMIFGRGATGGLINRVTKAPNATESRAASLTLGSYNNRRVTADINQPVNDTVAVRLNAMYQKSDSYRDGVWLERSGINPTVAVKVSPRTSVTLGYEHFEDDRIADRGIPSSEGKPVDTDPSTFFGNAKGSPTNTKLDAVTSLVQHDFENGTLLRNRTRYANQEKFYQNVFPGAVNTAGTMVAISAYNNSTDRESLFNQTDLTLKVNTGAIKHTVLTGIELGAQDTSNFRNTGYFPGNATSVNVPLSNPVTNLPITYRQKSDDADNNSVAKVAALYVQDQIELSPQFQVIGGLRYDRFSVDFKNNRNGDRFETTDNLVSPRVGVIYKPVEAMSLYANYSVAYQPRSGDQLSSLTAKNSSLDPEEFKNYEIGMKWDVRRNLAATAALFRLDRSNVLVLDPTDPQNLRTMLSDGQRTDGFELGLNGNLTRDWTISGGYAYTKAEFIGRTGSTLESDGEVGQVPRHTFTLWNRYDFTPAWAAALGVLHRTKMLAANELDNAASNVDLPSYTRFDGAVFYEWDKNTKVQLNVENLFDEEYYINANSNSNITPGSPRAYRVSLNVAF